MRDRRRRVRYRAKREASRRRRLHKEPTKPHAFLTFDHFRYRLGPTGRSHLPTYIALHALAAAVLASCATAPPAALRAHPLRISYVVRSVAIDSLADRSQSWRTPLAASELRGLRLLYDTPVPGKVTLAILRSVVRSNHRLDPFDALVFATEAVRLARLHRLDPAFFASVLLQESAFSPDALSPAGAVGIAQFTLDTAASEGGDDPFDWRAALAGGAALLGRYVNAYSGIY
ncbi:MAG: transglycosylase SLT domain-containing protein, partial [Candidatus Eremiobacteraeota bacterium]|nr:transglycosylase SLT domain-containing protein [Candidatus Eremiobacteraeota bacterium]